jgi:cytochrome c peroxidase
MKKIFGVLVFIIFSLCYVNASSDLMKEANENFKPIPMGPPVIKDNPLTTTKIQLGKMLFFDPRLSSSHWISCNSCHNLSYGGSDYQETALGHGWQRGPRNSPTVLNAVYNVAQFWDGRAKDLKEQAKGPVQASVEMNNKPEVAVATIKSMPVYVDLFEKAFPNDKNPVTFDNIARAIEAFEATLITPDCKLDRFLKGEETALNKNEKKGLKLFIDKGCTDCHGGVNIGGDDYFTFGVEKAPSNAIMKGDKGRAKITHAKDDEFSFRSPSLRNVYLTPPYFHSGAVWSLADAVKVMGDSQLGENISDEGAMYIVEFLKSLTGVQPEIEIPLLPPSNENTPKPIKK